jgi:predicted transcriptional regulator
VRRKQVPPLTDAEARVMGVLWQRQSATVADVVAALKRPRPVTYSTVQTILRILEHKGYLAHEKVSRAFIYRPIVDERQARRFAWRQLATRLFNGSPSLLVLNVIEDEPLDAAEIARLRALIDEA